MNLSETPIGDLAEFVNGMAFKPSDWEGTGRRIIRIQNLNDPAKPYNRTTKEVAERFLVEPDDILVSWSASLGVFVWDGPDTALLNQHIFRVRPDLTRVGKFYFKYALEMALNRMSRFLHGSTMKHVNRREFLGTRVFLPSLAEQKRIAAILDKADAVRRKRQEAIRLTEEFLRSAFLEMFGDPATNPKKWPVTKINDILDHERDGTRCGPFGSALPKRDYVAQGIPVWGIDNVQPNRFVRH